MISRAMGARKPGSQGEHAISVKTIAQGMPDVLAEPVVSAASFSICWRAMGAASTRHSLRPLTFRGPEHEAQLGRDIAARIHSLVSSVIARRVSAEAIQSLGRGSGLLRFARNDG